MTYITPSQKAAANSDLRRLYVYNGGFLTKPRIRRILQLSGWDIRLGLPQDDQHIGVWGKSPTSRRGETIARRHENPIIRVEDAFLRSVLPGRSGAPPLGLFIDDLGVHFDSTKPSRLEDLLSKSPLDDTPLLSRAQNAMARIKDLKLSKYNAFDETLTAPDVPFVFGR